MTLRREVRAPLRMRWAWCLAIVIAAAGAAVLVAYRAASAERARIAEQKRLETEQEVEALLAKLRVLEREREELIAKVKAPHVDTLEELRARRDAIERLQKLRQEQIRRLSKH